MRIRWFTLGAAASVALGASACSDSTSPSVNLSGSYSLVSIQFPPQSALTPPTATGTFTLTANAQTPNQGTYTLHLVIQGQPPVDDNGTYSLNGSNWSQSSTTTGQASGTYSLSGSTLTVNATNSGVTSISVWQKQ